MAVCAVGCTSLAAPAAAGEPPPGSSTAPAPTAGDLEGICPYCGVTPEHPHGRRGLHWHDHWGRVGLREAVTIGAAAAGYAVLLLTSQEREADWSGPILFDEGVRDALRFHSRSGRLRAARVSDGLAVLSITTPVLVDNVIVTWVARESPEVAWQMAVINAQAFTLTLTVNAAVKRLTARARPFVDECRGDSDYSPGCGTAGQTQSFYSGHAAVTATAAGLLCAHHTQLALYGSPLLDTGTCGLAIAATAATGALRIASDNHWTSDVLVGHLMGYASGYVMPTLLYYHEFRARPEPPHAPAAPTYAVRATLIPVVSDRSAELRLVGMF